MTNDSKSLFEHLFSILNRAEPEWELPDKLGKFRHFNRFYAIKEDSQASM